MLWIKIAFSPSAKRIRLLKGIHKGKMLFLIGIGLSLGIDDLDLLYKNKCICMSVNIIYHLFDMTSWRPDYYFVSDRESIEEYGT